MKSPEQFTKKYISTQILKKQEKNNLRKKLSHKRKTKGKILAFPQNVKYGITL